MPRNTTHEDFVKGMSHFQDYGKALQYEAELSYYRKHGVLPPNAECIKLVHSSDGKRIAMPK